jgi:hypothetical protein
VKSGRTAAARDLLFAFFPGEVTIESLLVLPPNAALVFRLLTHLRRPFHVALAVLVVAALSRCLREDALELSQWRQGIAFHQLGLPAPIETPVHDCDREYGCICRGATVVHAVDLSSFADSQIDLLPSADGSSTCGALLVNSAALVRPLDADSTTPPLSGRQLRALYASLVI